MERREGKQKERKGSERTRKLKGRKGSEREIGELK